jgi:hypothetical protein
LHRNTSSWNMALARFSAREKLFHMRLLFFSLCQPVQRAFPTV